MEEIRRSPVEVGSLSHCLQGFVHSKWFSRPISEPSIVPNIWSKLRKTVKKAPFPGGARKFRFIKLHVEGVRFPMVIWVFPKVILNKQLPTEHQEEFGLMIFFVC